MVVATLDLRGEQSSPEANNSTSNRMYIYEYGRVKSNKIQWDNTFDIHLDYISINIQIKMKGSCGLTEGHVACGFLHHIF